MRCSASVLGAVVLGGVLWQAVAMPGEAPGDKDKGKDKAPGAAAPEGRKPKDLTEVLKGTWTGLFEIAQGAHGQKPVKSAAKLVFTDDLEKTTGKMASFTIVKARLKSFDAANRYIEFNVTYKVGNSNWDIAIKATFAADWNSMEGTGALVMGTGPCKLVFGEGHEYDPKKPEWQDKKDDKGANAGAPGGGKQN